MDSHDWDARYAEQALVWSAGPNQFVAAELDGVAPGRALDLACGEGRNARWLAEQGWHVVGMDYSRVAVEKARQLTDAVDWRVGDALTAELPAGLDLVVVAYLQIPAADRRTALRRAFEALRTGGTLIVVAHDSSNLTEGTGGPQDPEVLYTAQDVLADLAGCDLEVLRADRVARTVPAADGHGPEGTAWDTLVRVVCS